MFPQRSPLRPPRGLEPDRLPLQGEQPRVHAVLNSVAISSPDLSIQIAPVILEPKDPIMIKHCFTTQADLYHHIVRQSQRSRATCNLVYTRPVALSLLQRMRKAV